jgi:hypothetical protein
MIKIGLAISGVVHPAQAIDTLERAGSKGFGFRESSGLSLLQSITGTLTRAARPPARKS